MRREALSTIRRKTAEHMELCWRTIPHVTLFAEADVTEIERTRKQYQQQGTDEDQDGTAHITITAVLVKVTAAALRAFPNVNASVDLDAGELIVKDYVNVGVAVDTPEGLVVPVVRDADRKGIAAIARELSELSRRAREGDLTPGDMSGGTFSLTNLGSVGVGAFTPIVNHPEIAILGVGYATREHRHEDGESIELRRRLPLGLSIDHRALDGADGARFLRWIVEAIEDPIRVSMET